MSDLFNFTKKQKRAERKMQKLLFGNTLPGIKKCTKKSQNVEIKILRSLG